MKITWTGFAGASKALEAKLLPEGVGVDSRNQKPGRGDLRPWRVPLTVASVPSGRKTIYRMGRDVADDSAYWLSWSTVVHAARGFIASDTTERTYFTGSGTPKVTDNLTGLASAPYPSAQRELGVPTPSTPLVLTQTAAGTGADETRFYVQTFLTDRGEESAPSAVTTVVCKPGAVFDITGLAAAPAGNYGITVRRIYRTVTGTADDADFFRILEIDATLTTATDAPSVPSNVKLASNGPTGEVGRAWTPPPADLKQLTAMWNGMMAGISGRSVRYCEAYRPHAWPIKYETLPPDVTPIALATWDKNLFILTNGRPYVVGGSIPSDLGDDPIDFDESCIGERSATATRDGVCWASPDGLAYVGRRQPQVLTRGVMLREDWQALKPETIIGTQYEGAYMGLYEPTPGSLKAFLIDPENPTGIYFLDVGYSAAYLDKLTDSLYVLDGTNIKKWDAGASFMTATAKSRVYLMPRPVNLGYMKVTASAFPCTVTITAKWTDDGGSVRTVTQTRTITSAVPTTLQGGFKATEWQIEIGTAGAVQGIVLAETIDEVRAT